jgi:hypothetical protein
MAVRLLETQDIFDFYGCEFLLRGTKSKLEPDERKTVEYRLNEIHEIYVNSVRERIKAELVFCGVKEIELNVGFSIKSMITKADDMLAKEMEKQANKMMFGGGFNMMGVMMAAHQQAGGDMAGFDKSKLKKMGLTVPKEPVKKVDNSVQENMDKGFFHNPKWKTIADAFIALEEAKDIDAKISAIDFLNDLQHNSFHLLIDLQTGRMLENNSKGGSKGKHGEAVNIVKEVLDIKQGAASPKEFADKMGEEIKDLIMHSV